MAADEVLAARALAPLAAELAPQAERERTLPRSLVDAVAHAGLFRLCVPREAGGLEADPATLVGCAEALAVGDGAAGWCLAIGATSGLLTGYLPLGTAREVFASPTAIAGGVFAPRGRAVVEGEGFRVSGRWPFASGCRHCDWLMGGAMVEGDPLPQLMLARASEVQILDTWHVSGLRGTGSEDIVMDGVFVPAGRAGSLFGRPVAEGPLYAFPAFGLLAVAIAGVALGIGRGALDDVLGLGAKVPTAGTRALAERPMVQVEVARAEAALRAARALLYEAIGEAWSAAQVGGLDERTRLGLRLAASQAVSSAADVAGAAYRLGGGSALYDSSPLQRRLRDANAATQHMLVAPATFELTGRLLLGVPTDTSQL
jgi:alkylation response protein AidB-like acyl-CoA dehydrogenase